ncbi:restriction endonuclease subunit S [Uliginosibacterium sp. H1]|uniref:restriction endonuclease subunit S n=1 Tax=Uliginosibacterium sp. H1 TaxID=3114757 RepID=UPI002E19A8C1|nr:restriction endonuclease subunit S [Uliginosibacterium sp. H1]
MEKESKKALVPKLRFPEFQGAAKWKEMTLGSEATFHKGRGISKAEVDPNGNRLCIRYGELYTRYGETILEVVSRTNLPEWELFLSRKNDVIIPASGETKEDIATASCVLLDEVALGSDLNVIRTRHNGVFLSYFLNGPKRRAVAKVAQGDTVVHLYPSQLAQLEIAFPDEREQQKVADCLSSLDELIAAQGRKVEALKTYKRGLMQQLFPREGETLPGLRFPEFASAGSWHTQKIASLLSKASVSVSVEPDLTYREIGIRSHGKGIFHKEPTLGKVIGEKRVFQVVQDALVLNIVFAWEQAVATTTENEIGMIASHRFPMYVAKPGKCDVEYVKGFFLTKEGKRLLGVASPGGAGRNKTLGQKEFENLEIALPVSVDEQTRIANCLSSLDTKITIESDRLESLKAHKQGLMQQLFPSLEEA